MLHFKNADDLQKSFNAYAKQPGNVALVEQAQIEELHALLDAEDMAHLSDVCRKLNCLDKETQRILAPFLQHRPLLRVISSLFNDPATDINAWASNPIVLKMLREARRLLREGAFNEQELEAALLAYLKHPKSPHKSDFEQHIASRRTITAPEQLSAVMNEQLDERQQGNRAYTAGDPQTALHHYTRGLAMLRLLRPDNSSDQQLIQEAESVLLLNSAAAHLAVGAYGACVAACSAVLSYDPANVVAHVRRARAQMKRREYQAAEEDLGAADKFSNGSRQPELQKLRNELRLLRLHDRETDKRVYERMFKA